MAKLEYLLKQLDTLLPECDYLLSSDTWLTDEKVGAQARVYSNRLEAVIERICLPESTYRKQLDLYRSMHLRHKFADIHAVATALREDLHAGWIDSVVELVHAQTYSDYLEMADGLLNVGYKDPAAVIVGTSLEVHLRALCVKHGIDTEAAPGKPRKADVLNADLKKAGVYDGLRQKQITAWMDLRNKAAHGDYASYDEHQVRMFIDGVRDFMLKNPA
ncbi:hypothetical protein ACFYQQ_09725 [Streptomyces sp. NPDC005496]|uniref:hypothetical protein n=1 Tax=unclassified Streptomyces TaxID=2593676 RepID=UPI0033A986F7